MTSTVRLLQSLNLQLQTLSCNVFPGTSLAEINRTFGSFGSSCAFFVTELFYALNLLDLDFFRSTVEFNFEVFAKLFISRSSPLKSLKTSSTKTFLLQNHASPPSLVFIIWTFPIIICMYLECIIVGNKLSSSYLQNWVFAGRPHITFFG